MALEKEKAAPYSDLKEKAARGEYELIDPLDYLILGFLPDEGSMFAGLYPVGETMRNILRKFTPQQQEALDLSILTTRMKVLQAQNLVSKTTSATNRSKGFVWQRTKAGKRLHKNWEVDHGGSREEG